MHHLHLFLLNDVRPITIEPKIHL